jgi:transcriptional regulator with XRE-family HTH domain
MNPSQSQIEKNREFGSFLRTLFAAKKISTYQLAKKIGVSYSYLSGCLKGRVPPPSVRILDLIILELALDKRISYRIYDLAAIAHNTCPADLIEPILQEPRIRNYIRTNYHQL